MTRRILHRKQAGINVHDIDSWFALESAVTSEKGEIHLKIKFKDSKIYRSPS